jgi:FkbM family methyltransferase
MIDVGANVGYFSLLWTTVNRHNLALAFEASPRNQGMLRANVEANGLRDRIQIYPFALGHSESTLAFDLGPLEQTGWGGLSLSPSDRTIQVRVRRLDDLISNTEQIAVLKIDTEGADFWVLMGAERLLQRNQIDHIFFESNHARMELLEIRLDDVVTFLNRCGYEVTRLDAEQFHATPLEG